jgi:hypothetical protein
LIEVDESIQISVKRRKNPPRIENKEAYSLMANEEE